MHILEADAINDQAIALRPDFMQNVAFQISIALSKEISSLAKKSRA